MAYTPNIPAASDIIANSQSQLQTNSSAIDTQYGGDHDGFSIGASNSGMHKKATFLSNIAAPGLTVNLVNGVAALFANLDSNATSQLFFENASGTQQITSSMTTLGSFRGWILPGGLKLCITAGTIAFGSAGIAHTLPFSYTSTSSYVVLVTPEGATPTIDCSVVNTAVNQFTGYSGSSSNSVYVMTIGY